MYEKEHAQFDESALALRAGRITGSEFLTRTAAVWRDAAARLWARWRRRLPSWVERDDILQELQVLAIEHVCRWQEGRGGIGAYVVWSATRRAQRQIHRWRGASLSGNEGANASRAEISFSRAFPLDPLGTRVPDAAADPQGEDAIEGDEVFGEAIDACRTSVEAIVLLALRECEGSIALSAQAIYNDFSARVECAVSSPQQAERLVRKSLTAVANRVQEEAEISAAQILRSSAAA